MAKATHKGTCQICGKSHKLPNGRLSKHGYTVDFGTFNGTCTGAEGLPFEKSTDLIAGAIEKVKASIEDTLEEIKALDTKTDKVHVRFCTTVSPAWGVLDASEVHTKVINAELGINKYYVNNPHQTRVPVLKRVEIASHSSAQSLEDCIIAHNKEGWAHILAKRVESMEKYIEWQHSRLEGWTEKELTPL